MPSSGMFDTNVLTPPGVVSRALVGWCDATCTAADLNPPQHVGVVGIRGDGGFAPTTELHVGMGGGVVVVVVGGGVIEPMLPHTGVPTTHIGASGGSSWDKSKDPRDVVLCESVDGVEARTRRALSLSFVRTPMVLPAFSRLYALRTLHETRSEATTQETRASIMMPYTTPYLPSAARDQRLRRFGSCVAGRSARTP